MTKADERATEIENVAGTPDTPDTPEAELSPTELDGVNGAVLGGFSARAFNPQPEPPRWSHPDSTVQRRR